MNLLRFSPERPIGVVVYSHVATGAVLAAIPASAAASGLAPVHVAVVVGTSAAGMVGLVGLLRFAHRAAKPQ